MNNLTVIRIQHELDIVEARQKGREISKKMAFGSVDQVRITTAISELARNIYLYAGSGEITLEELADGHKAGIKVAAVDKGPGIADIKKVLEDGYSTSGGLGAGIPGVKRLMDEFTIDSVFGEGTTITAIKWLRKR
ncbi:anti-sigma regulatory factor [Peribacillus deserti]|uniref:ATP-binding protein n=1 Tax=Peribacillus deserti TaxID=673318 RepID=A0A2N5MAB2_9BACI|nr:anti-sigma regulatory factor [Peribacillus deserti]PLT31294.1 ATP-binding protein [Peribacillus deserti]